MPFIPNDPEFPKIRPVDLHPVHQAGVPAFIVHDPLQLKRASLILPAAVAPVVYLYDGTRSHAQVRSIFRDHMGVPIRQDFLPRLIHTFDEMLLLENNRFNQAKKQALAAYRSGPFRLPFLAGTSYPRERGQLARLFERQLGSVNGHARRGKWAGLLSPHIDYNRGISVYAEVWKPAREAINQADLIVILGTDHFGGESPFTLTRQNYATPFGVLPTEVEIVNALAEALGEEQAFAGELFHKTEHSIELVVAWAQHLREEPPCPIVPILCGPFAEYVYGEAAIEQSEEIRALEEVLQETTRNRRAFFVISGDLSHLGPAFNSPAQTKENKQALRDSDFALLEQLGKGDEQAFIAGIQAVHGQNNICGTIPIYASLRAFPVQSGEIVAYRQCPADDQNTSVVSIAGVLFEA